MGGFNLPSVKLLALPCFLSSTHASTSMVKTLLVDRGLTVDGVEAATAMWNDLTGLVPLDSTASSSQRKWLKAVSQKRYQELIDNSPDSHTALRLRCLACAEAGAFLTGHPSNRIRARLDGPAFECAVRLRQGQPAATSSHCACGEELDPLGIARANLQTWRRQANSSSHYQRIRARRLRVSWAWQWSSNLPGLSRDDGRRPDGVTVLPFSDGRALAWDATCWNPLAPSHAAAALKKNGAVAEIAEVKTGKVLVSAGPR